MLKLCEPSERNAIVPEHMSLYPTMGSLSEAVLHIESRAPLSTPNEVFSALMLYHNSLLAQLDRDGCLK